MFAACGWESAAPIARPITLSLTTDLGCPPTPGPGAAGAVGTCGPKPTTSLTEMAVAEGVTQWVTERLMVMVAESLRCSRVVGRTVSAFRR